MIVVDASIWVARLVPQDAFCAVSSRWMAVQRTKNIRLISPALLLPEVAGAVGQRTGDHDLASQAVEMLQHIPGVHLVEMDQSLVTTAAELASQLGLRGADAIYVATAVTLALPLCTLDEDQARRAARQVAVLRLELDSQP
jgi:predicted nucleic acid-binding protein